MSHIWNAIQIFARSLNFTALLAKTNSYDFFLQLGRACFGIIFRQSDNFSFFCKVFFSQIAFRNVIVPLANPKRASSNARTPLPLSHMLFYLLTRQFFETPPRFTVFFYVSDVAWSSHGNKMSKLRPEAFRWDSAITTGSWGRIL